MRLLTAAVAFAALASVACTQEKDDSAPNVVDMAAMLRAGQPGEHHKALDVLVGKWDVATKFRMAPNAPEQEGTATCEAKWILGGRFLMQHYSSMMMGEPFECIQYLGYDNVKKKHVEISFHNMVTSLLHNEGECSGDGKTITHIGMYDDPSAGKPTKLRTVYSIIDKDHFTLEWFSTVGDGKEMLGVSLKHTRRKE